MDTPGWWILTFEELVRRYAVADHLSPPDRAVTFLAHHDGVHWVSGTLWGDFENVYQFDLETGERSESMAVSELPLVFFDSGGEKWERYREFETGHWPIRIYGIESI